VRLEAHYPGPVQDALPRSVRGEVEKKKEEEKEEAVSRRGLGAGFARNPIADCGLRIADCGLRIADCGLKITAGRSPHEEFFAAGEEMYG
jgi:hypothetical protein